MNRCVLCHTTDGTLDRRCGLDVCPACSMGGLEDGLERWGLRLEERRWTESGGRDSHKTVDCLEVKISFPTPFDGRAHFRREAGMDRLIDWFRADEPQGGDPLFDRAVFVEQSEGDMLGALLQDEGAQGAIMELVASGGARLGDGWVRARRGSSLVYPALHVTAVPLVLLAVHVETITRLTDR